MNRRMLIISVVTLLVIAGTGLYFGRVLKSKQDGSLKSDMSAATQAPIELESWKDQSEFEFRYPKNLTLDEHPEDQENYAHVELKSNAFPGNIILWTKDTKYQSLEDYVKGEKIQNQIGSTLGGLPAAKILDPQNANKFSLLTVRNGYLYEVEVDSLGEKVWNEVFNMVADSYKFIESEPTQAVAQNAVVPQASEEIYTEEEVIE